MKVLSTNERHFFFTQRMKRRIIKIKMNKPWTASIRGKETKTALSCRQTHSPRCQLHSPITCQISIIFLELFQSFVFVLLIVESMIKWEITNKTLIAYDIG